MKKIVIHQPETLAAHPAKSRAQNILRSVINVAVKILLSVLMWVILTAAFFVL